MKDNSEKKCDKYESLFVFADEKTLNEHIQNCPDCNKEHEEMQIIAELVKETKPLILQERAAKKTSLKVAAALSVSILAFLALTQFNQPRVHISSSLDTFSLKDSSVITKMGLPADEYGLLIVE